MIAAPRKYQASFFSDFNDIKPSAESIPPFLKMFADKNLLPTVFTEIGLGLPSPETRPRLRLMSPDGLWTIDFDSARILIEKTTTAAIDQALGTPEEFTNDATDFLTRILTTYPKKGNRLSLVTSGWMAEMKKERLQEIYPLFAIPIGFYKDNLPINWSSRAVTRINVELSGRNETINVISQVARVQGRLMFDTSETIFDRIQLDLDINTYQGNKETRFDSSSLKPFFDAAIKIHEDLVTQTEERLYE